jgi:hypothetical protein
MNQSQGSLANRQGIELQNSVEAKFHEHDFRRLSPRKANILTLAERLGGWMPQPAGVYARNIRVCEDVHGQEFKAHFGLHRGDWPGPVAFACKRQSSTGSATHKLEHLFQTVIAGFPCPCVVLLSGKENEQGGVVRRALQCVEMSRGRLHVLVGFDDFQDWVVKGFPYPAGDNQYLFGPEHG